MTYDITSCFTRKTAFNKTDTCLISHEHLIGMNVADDTMYKFSQFSSTAVTACIDNDNVKRPEHTREHHHAHSSWPDGRPVDHIPNTLPAFQAVCCTLNSDVDGRSQR